MGVPKKHHTKSKVGRRRSHLRLKPTRPLLCPNCKAPPLPHRACVNCGAYGTKVTPAVAAPSTEEEDE